jgi:hypothetical protein
MRACGGIVTRKVPSGFLSTGSTRLAVPMGHLRCGEPKPALVALLPLSPPLRDPHRVHHPG